MEIGKSYVAVNGFGHEEWLFNYDWTLHSNNPTDNHLYKYGYLQPIAKFQAFFQRTSFDVLLYTISPDRRVLLIATIKDLYVPDSKELEWVRTQIKSRGWLEEMSNQLDILGINSSPLLDPSPSALVNVRFLPRNVTFYDPWLEVEGAHKIRRIFRYQPYDWDDGFPPVKKTHSPVTPPKKPGNDAVKFRSEAMRIRAAIQGTEYDPRHNVLQNMLYHHLCSIYGVDSVQYELNFVDLSYKSSGGITYLEIKMEHTVKRCIRLAIGQLLEYSHYPDQEKACRLLVVGEIPSTKSDRIYLEYLRRLYGLPIFYARWDWDEEKLKEEI